ncbi:hypothetical protein [Streptomyces sp. Tue6028]|uniref:hypothetical protein n=1 Tax=Streptomyces sp. Tue6028 TaxID=2036037 RepID=UPI003D728D60
MTRREHAEGIIATTGCPSGRRIGRGVQLQDGPAERLSRLVRPFLLRRKKSDPGTLTQ